MKITKSKWKGITCSIKECDRQVMARGLCFSHYKNMHEGRDIVPLRKLTGRPITHLKGCAMPDCDKPHFAKTLCQRHYAYLLHSKRGAENSCQTPGCDIAHYAKGFCRGHYFAQYINAEGARIRAQLRFEHDDEDAA